MSKRQSKNVQERRLNATNMPRRSDVHPFRISLLRLRITVTDKLHLRLRWL